MVLWGAKVVAALDAAEANWIHSHPRPGWLNEFKSIASIRHVVDIYQEPNWTQDRSLRYTCVEHWCGRLKQNHMAVAYFPWYFTRRSAWKPRPRRGSGFHAGSASEVSWKICNNKCGFVFIPRLYPCIYQATHITHLDWLPKYDFESCRLQVFKQM